jgi:hypothetical protein
MPIRIGDDFMCLEISLGGPRVERAITRPAVSSARLRVARQELAVVRTGRPDQRGFAAVHVAMVLTRPVPLGGYFARSRYAGTGERSGKILSCRSLGSLLPRGGSFEYAAGEAWWLTPGEEPAAKGSGGGNADDSDGEVEDGRVA